MAPLRCAAKYDPFLSLDCAPHPPPWRNPRKGRDQILPSGNLEVVAFLVAVVFGGVLLLAWMSTNVRERPRVEAVLVRQMRPGVVVAEEISRDDARLAHFEGPQTEEEDVQRG